MKKIYFALSLLFILTCVNAYGFDKRVRKQGYSNGKNWEMIYDSDKVRITGENEGLIVDGIIVIPCQNYAMDTITIGRDIFFIVEKSKSGKSELFNIKGERALSIRFDLIHRGGSDGNLEGLYEFNTIDGSTHRQHLVDSKLNVIKSGYDGYARRINVEGYSGYFIQVPSGTSGTCDLYDSNLKLLKSGFSRASGGKLEGRNENYIVLTYNKNDSYDSEELYTTDFKLALPRYKYLWQNKDSQGNFQYWYIKDSNGYVGRLDKNWNWIIPLDKRFSEIYDTTIAGVKYYKCKKGGYWGLFDLKFCEVIAPEFEDMGMFDGTNFIKFKLNGFWGVMTLQGRVTKTIIPTTRGYTSIDRYIKSQKRFTYTMTGYKGECNHLGQQLSKIKDDTPRLAVATTTPTSSSSSSSSSTSSTATNSSSNSNSGSGTTQTIVVEHHRDPVPVQEWQACWACGGMGTMGCDNCGGSGTKYIGDRLHRCSRCNGQGIIPCNICYGNKGKYITVYR